MGTESIATGDWYPWRESGEITWMGGGGGLARSSHLISHGLSLGDSCVESPAGTASPAEGLGYSPGREQRLGSGEKGQGSLVSSQQNPVGEGRAAALRHPTSEALMPQRDRNTPPEGEGETEGTGADVGAMVSVCLLRQTHWHHLTPCDSPFGMSFLGTALLFGDPHGNRIEKRRKQRDGKAYKDTQQ